VVEFRILGPLEAVDSEPLALGGHKQRAVLAVLLLHRGEAVAADRLIEAVWEGQAPATAGKTVQVYISNLRKVLGEGPLVTRGRGYVLEVERDQVDADQFEKLAARGREALEQEDPQRARMWLEAALALWRGPALADFSYESFAQSEIARLEEIRMAALESRIEADLRLGGHAALVPELEALVHEHPLRERLYEQLMIALYRSGRQVDALERYQRARRKLIDEFGIEPGPRLQEIQRAVLTHDRTLDLPGRREIPQPRGPDGRSVTAPVRQVGSRILAMLASLRGLLSLLRRKAGKPFARLRGASQLSRPARVGFARRWEVLRRHVAGGTWAVAAAGALVVLVVVLVFTLGGHSGAHAHKRGVATSWAGITTPSSGSVYPQGQWVPTSFSCRQAKGGPGLRSCSDSTGTATVSGGQGHLDTSSTGMHRYWVAATTMNGHARTTSITYTVVPPPSVSAHTPVAIVAHGRTSITLACGGGGVSAACRGTLSLVVARRVVQRVGQRRVATVQTVRLAGTTYSLAVGARRSIVVPLTDAGILALRGARGHQLGVTATATVTGGKTAEQAITLRRRQRR
jgi:DNA-binding SARP family transcriptional activator